MHWNSPTIFGDPDKSAVAHAPFALLAASPLCDAAGAFLHEPAFWSLSFWCLLAGLLFAVPTLVAGLWECASLPAEHPNAALSSHHMTLLLGAAGEFTGSLLVRGGGATPMWSGFALATSLIGLVLLVAAAFHGGALLCESRRA